MGRARRDDGGVVTITKPARNCRMQQSFCKDLSTVWSRCVRSTAGCQSPRRDEIPSSNMARDFRQELARSLPAEDIAAGQSPYTTAPDWDQIALGSRRSGCPTRFPGLIRSLWLNIGDPSGALPAQPSNVVADKHQSAAGDQGCHAAE